MRIGMVLDKPYPPDIRVDKEAQALASAGHDLSLLAYDAQDSNLQEDPSPDLALDTIARPGKTLKPLRRRWNSLRYLLTFRNAYWEGHIARFARERLLDVLHVHDLPLAGSAIQVGRELDIPVVLDLHEHYPALRASWLQRPMTAKVRLTARRRAWTRYEQRATRAADQVVVVCDEAMERLVGEHNIAPSKIVVVMNTTDPGSFVDFGLSSAITERYADRFVLAYVGGGGQIRGLDTVIKALPTLREVEPAVLSLFVGLPEDERQRFEAMAKAIEVEGNLEVLGWQPMKMVPTYMSLADICLLPLRRNALTDTTLAHKLFQYMLLGKPVIVSDCRPLRRIVETIGSGLVFKAGDEKDFSAKTVALLRDSELRSTLGERGRQAVLRQFNWSMESVKLVDLYDRIK